MTDYSTTEDTQAYADQAGADALADAQTYTDAAKEELVEKIATSHDEVVQLVIDHAVPAAAAAAAGAFDPTVLDPIRTAFTTADTALSTRIDSIEKASTAAAKAAVSGSLAGVAGPLTLWTGTKAQYDALTTKDAGTVYFIQ
jgi:trans-2-enoyl-CoA reductase